METARHSVTPEGHLSRAINLLISVSAAFQGADMLSEWGNLAGGKHPSAFEKLLLLGKIKNSFWFIHSHISYQASSQHERREEE